MIDLSDTRGRIVRAMDALADGDTYFAAEILRDLEVDLADETMVVE